MTMHWIVFAGHLLAATPLYAQGGFGATQNQYCAQFSDGSSLDCGFSSLQMCEQSVTGVGGVCILNPSGPSRPPVADAQDQAPSYQSSAMPPPPFAQQASAPLQLPDAVRPRPCDPLIDGTYCASAGNMAPIQSAASDLAIGGDPPATLGAVTFSGDGAACIGLFRRSYCGGT
jgi:hypothetical protein